MGCASSIPKTCSVGSRKKTISIPEIVVFVPSMRVPVRSDLQRTLRGLIPRDLVDKLASLRNQIVLVAEETVSEQPNESLSNSPFLKSELSAGGSAATELLRILDEYLPVLLGLTKKEYGLEELVEFKWKNLEGGRQETNVANSWFELLSMVHMMAVLTLSEANSLLIPKDHHSGSCERAVSADSKRDAVELLLKASGYLDFCVQDVLAHLHPDIKKRFPKDLQVGVLQAISIQALGQGTELQLSLAVESQKATLSVKRRLACEQMSYFSQAHYCLSGCDMSYGHAKKHLLFMKWKYLEAKAAAYYYHGLILDKGNEPSCHVSVVCCFLAAEELLSESKKAFLSFCLALPVTRAPPLCGSMKLLHQKVPDIASKKSQMYGYLLEQEKSLQALPDLPEFQLSLRPDEYQLPEIHPAWDSEEWENQGQTLKEHLRDSEDETELS